MTLDEVYMELLAGKQIKLRFESLQHAKNFRSSLAVFIHRQNKRLDSLGMGDETTGKGLNCVIEDTTLEVSYKRRKPRQHNFQILEIVQKNEAGDS